VLFDASILPYSGLSHSQLSAVGERVQPMLYNILLAFSKHKFGVSADIQQMYLQIMAKEKDQDCQRIFWRNEDGKVFPWAMTRLKFGTSSAAYLAIRVLKMIGEE
jgi:hypothetical protein